MTPGKTKIPSSIKSLGGAIRHLREKRRMTLRALAKQVEISAPFLSDIEHNRRNTDKLPLIAKILGVEVRELKSLDPRLPAEVKDWISSSHEIGELLKDMQASGHTAGVTLEELAARIVALEAELAAVREKLRDHEERIAAHEP